MRSSRTPRVTVAIPTHNRAQLLRECLRSVLDQSLKEMEVFVSDNASTDETGAVVASFSDARVHYARLERNIGVYRNMSRCLRLGEAPFVVVFPDDDLMLPDNLERKARFLEQHPAVGMVHSAYQVLLVGPGGAQILEDNVNWVGSQTNMIEPGSVVIRRLLTEGYSINLTTGVMRRSVVLDESYEEADGPPSDLGLCLRMARRADVGYIAQPLIVSRFHPEADHIRAGTYEFESGALHETFALIEVVQRTKERFLAQYGHEMPDVKEVRAASRRHMQQAIMHVLLRKLRRERTTIKKWRVLREAARVDPAVWFAREPTRHLAASMLGPASRRLVRVILGPRKGCR